MKKTKKSGGKPTTKKRKTTNSQTAHKTSKKTTGKCSSAQKNSVKKAVSTKPKAQAKPTAPKRTAERQNVGEAVVLVEIRTHNDSNGGHPHIMIDTVDNKKVSVGVTHDKYKGKGHANYPLKINPTGSHEQAYIHKQGTVANARSYTRPRKGKMTAPDNKKAKQIGAQAKQKYISNKDKNKKKK